VIGVGAATFLVNNLIKGDRRTIKKGWRSGLTMEDKQCLNSDKYAKISAV